MALIQQKISWPFPGYEPRILLHCCCAVCAGEIIERLLSSDIIPAVYFYNPNITFYEEYHRRKADIVRFAQQKNILVFQSDYDSQRWLSYVQGFEQEPEGGKRCELCFFERLKETARCAYQKGYPVFASTLAISRYKNFALVTACGQKAASHYSGLQYWDYNWRKKGGSMRMTIIAQQQNFYVQDYCGCIFSFEQRTRQKKDTVHEDH